MKKIKIKSENIKIKAISNTKITTAMTWVNDNRIY